MSIDSIRMNLPLCRDNPEVEVVFDWHPGQAAGKFTEPITPGVDEIVAVYATRTFADTKEMYPTIEARVIFDLLPYITEAQMDAIEAHINKEQGE